MFCGLLPMCRACFSMKSTNFPPSIEMCVRRTTDRPFLSSFLVLIDIEKKTHLRISHFSDENYYLFELQTRENISLLPNDLHKIEICTAWHLNFNATTCTISNLIYFIFLNSLKAFILLLELRWVRFCRRCIAHWQMINNDCISYYRSNDGNFINQTTKFKNAAFGEFCCHGFFTIIRNEIYLASFMEIDINRCVYEWTMQLNHKTKNQLRCAYDIFLDRQIPGKSPDTTEEREGRETRRHQVNGIDLRADILQLWAFVKTPKTMNLSYFQGCENVIHQNCELLTNISCCCCC